MRATLFLAATALTLGACTASTTDQTNDMAMANDGMMATDDTAMGNDMMMANAGDPAATPSDAAGFVAMAGASDLYEKQSSQMALDKSQNSAVRDFAQMMITDHAKTTQAVKDAAATANLTVAPPTLNAEQQANIDQLKGLSGADFDKAYVAQQKPAHQKALDLMKNYAATGDTPALKDAATSAIPIIEKHIAALQNMTV